MASVPTVLFQTPRIVDPTAVPLPQRDIMDAVATGLIFPASMACDQECSIYVAEGGYAYGGVRTRGRILRVNGDSSLTPMIGGLQGPMTGIANHDGPFWLRRRGGPAGRISPAADSQPGMNK